MANTLGSKLEGLVPTCCAMLPTCVFTSSNKPERFDIMPAVRMPLIQSAMALRTVSIQQSPSLAEVVDKGLEKVQEKNNVGRWRAAACQKYMEFLEPPRRGQVSP